MNFQTRAYTTPPNLNWTKEGQIIVLLWKDGQISSATGASFFDYHVSAQGNPFYVARDSMVEFIYEGEVGGSTAKYLFHYDAKFTSLVELISLCQNAPFGIEGLKGGKGVEVIYP